MERRAMKPFVHKYAGAPLVYGCGLRRLHTTLTHPDPGNGDPGSEGSLGGEDDEHGTPFKLGHLLYRRYVCSFFGNTGKQLTSQSGEGNFTPAEHARHLNLVLLADKLFDVTDLGLQVMVTCFGPDLDLLHLEGALLLLRLLPLFGLFIFETTKIHNFANRGSGVRCHLNKVKPTVTGCGQCFMKGKYAQLGSIGTDDAHLSCSDLVVDVDSAAVSYVLLLVVYCFKLSFRNHSQFCG